MKLGDETAGGREVLREGISKHQSSFSSLLPSNTLGKSLTSSGEGDMPRVKPHFAKSFPSPTFKFKGTKCEVWSRVVGYLRPVGQFNVGKKQEFGDRRTFEL